MRCDRKVTPENVCAFDFDHREVEKKRQRKGVPEGIADMIRRSQAYFDEHYPVEVAKCDLLCANCHRVAWKIPSCCGCLLHG